MKSDVSFRLDLAATDPRRAAVWGDPEAGLAAVAFGAATHTHADVLFARLARLGDAAELPAAPGEHPERVTGAARVLELLHRELWAVREQGHTNLSLGAGVLVRSGSDVHVLAVGPVSLLVGAHGVASERLSPAACPPMLGLQLKSGIVLETLTPGVGHRIALVGREAGPPLDASAVFGMDPAPGDAPDAEGLLARVSSGAPCAVVALRAVDASTAPPPSVATGQGSVVMEAPPAPAVSHPPETPPIVPTPAALPAAPSTPTASPEAPFGARRILPGGSVAGGAGGGVSMAPDAPHSGDDDFCFQSDVLGELSEFVNELERSPAADAPPQADAAPRPVPPPPPAAPPAPPPTPASAPSSPAASEADDAKGIVPPAVPVDTPPARSPSAGAVPASAADPFFDDTNAGPFEEEAIEFSGQRPRALDATEESSGESVGAVVSALEAALDALENVPARAVSDSAITRAATGFVDLGTGDEDDDGAGGGDPFGVADPGGEPLDEADLAPFDAELGIDDEPGSATSDAGAADATLALAGDEDAIPARRARRGGTSYGKAVLTVVAGALVVGFLVLRPDRNLDLGTLDLEPVTSLLAKTPIPELWDRIRPSKPPAETRAGDAAFGARTGAPPDPSPPAADERADERVAEADAREAVDAAPEAPPRPATRAPEAEDADTKAPNDKSTEAQAPVTKAPVTKAPEPKAPEPKAPEPKAPVTKAPVTKAPVTKAPVTKAPEPENPPSRPKAATAKKAEPPAPRADEALPPLYVVSLVGPPGGRITIDGETLDQETPAREIVLDAGDHDIRVDHGRIGRFEERVAIDGEGMEIDTTPRAHIHFDASASGGQIEVVLDDRSLGTTPPTVHPVRAGARRVAFRGPGVSGSDRDVFVAGGDTAVVVLPAAPIGEALVVVTSRQFVRDHFEESEGDSIWLDRTFAGVTPSEVTVTPGVHGIRVGSRDGRERVTRIVEIPSGAIRVVRADFGSERRLVITHEPFAHARRGDPILLPVLIEDAGRPSAEAVRCYFRVDGGAFRTRAMKEVQDGTHYWVLSLGRRETSGDLLEYYFAAFDLDGVEVVSEIYQLPLGDTPHDASVAENDG